MDASREREGQTHAIFIIFKKPKNGWKKRVRMKVFAKNYVKNKMRMGFVFFKVLAQCCCIETHLQ